MSRSRPLPFVTLLLGWLIPGAAHAYVGRPVRAAIIFVVIGATFWGGVGIGGVLAVDYQNERWWFAGQMLTGIHGLVGWQRQKKVYAAIAAEAEIGPPPPLMTQRRGNWTYKADSWLAKEKLALVSPADTVARAYTGVAGLLNLMCVFDALMLSLMGVTAETPPPPRRTKHEQEKK